MTSAPYMRFFFGDYTMDTGHLTHQEHGVYFLLLKAMWVAGGKLPADDKRLARLALCTEQEWTGYREAILPFFKRRGGILRHKRIDAEIEHYKSRSENAKLAGKQSARQKANKNNAKPSTDVQRSFNQSDTEPDSRTEPLKGSSSTSDASEPARHEGAASPRPKPELRLVERDKPKPRLLSEMPREERMAVVAEILNRPKPQAPPPGPTETQAEMVERLRKSLKPEDAA